MSQQINLFHALPTLPPRRFTGGNIIFVWMVTVSFLLCAYIFQTVTYVSEKNKLTHLQQQEKQIAQRFSSVVEQFPVVAANEPNEKQVVKLALEVREEAHLINALLKSPQAQGFSTYLQVVAEHIPYGVWLQSMIFKPARGVIRLQGKSLAAPLIPQFEQSLRQQALFQSQQFHVLTLEKDDKKAWFRFTLTNEGGHGK